MTDAYPFILISTIFTYTCMCAIYLVSFFKEKPLAIKYLFYFLALFSHLEFLTILGILNGRLPFGNGKEALLSCLFLISLSYLPSIYYLKNKNFGAFIFVPITLVFIVTSLITPAISNSEFTSSYFFNFHIVISLTAYACFTITALFSIIYITLFYKIKKREFGVVFRNLPSLEDQEKTIVLWSITGIIFMILSSIIGKIGGISGMSLKEYFIFSVLIFFIISIVLHISKKITGFRFTLFNMLGFLLLIIVEITGVHGF